MAAKDGKPLTVERVEKILFHMNGDRKVDMSDAVQTALEHIVQALGGVMFRRSEQWDKKECILNGLFSNDGQLVLRLGVILSRNSRQVSGDPQLEVALALAEGDSVGYDELVCALLCSADGWSASAARSPLDDPPEYDVSKLPESLQPLVKESRGTSQMNDEEAATFIKAMLAFIRET